MGKRSGITKGGRVMNPADRERKVQRAKELKRNKKQRTAVRQAIVKSRDPEEIIEQMSRLDDQEFDLHRQLSLNVIQEKRHKLRGSFIQIINLSRQEKEDKKIKNLERMMYEYEIERRKKEENFRAMTFSENSNFDEIPLPIGINAPEAANTPFLINLPSGIGPQMPAKIAGTLKAGILKKTTGISIKKKHKYPPGPPPGIPPPLFESEEENDEEEQAGQDTREREDNRRRSKRVRFGDRSSKYRDEDDYRERNQEEEDEDYAPVEIPESMLASDQLQKPQQNQPVYSRPVSSISAPQVGPGSLPPAPGMAHPSHIPHHPAYLPPPGYMMQSGPPGSGAIQMAPSYPPGPNPTVPKSTGMANGASFPPDPHPSAIISAEPQVVKPNVNIPSQQTHSTSNESMLSAGPQMRNIRREATRFVPTAVKIQRSLVPPVANPGIGPRLPTGSVVASVAGPTRLVPHPIKNTEMRRSKLPGKGAARTPVTVGVATTQQPSKSVDEACDEFLKELQGLL